LGRNEDKHAEQVDQYEVPRGEPPIGRAGVTCSLWKQGVLHYLEDIKEFWSQLFAYNKQAMRMLDNVTVKAVELMAPRHSKRDAQMLQGQLASGQIFAAFSPQDRDAIWSKLRTASGLIPSLFTLFEDLKYLQACAGSMTEMYTFSSHL
jgi:hypothetical protein